MDIAQTITLDPRETWQGREHEATTFWLRGSRDRYGVAYFISTSGAEVTLWENHRPYGVNRQMGVLPTAEPTWADVDEIVYGRD